MCAKQGCNWRQAAAGGYRGPARPAGCWCLSFLHLGWEAEGVPGAPPKPQGPQPFWEQETAPSLALTPWGAGAGQDARAQAREGRCCTSIPWGEPAWDRGQGRPSPPPCCSTQPSGTPGDAERCPRCSAQVSWGLAER